MKPAMDQVAKSVTKKVKSTSVVSVVMEKVQKGIRRSLFRRNGDWPVMVAGRIEALALVRLAIISSAPSVRSPTLA
ncbi:MAG: hypothetical protein Q7S48_03530 [bacterium]|nr:hypothetical protein [bacterium]